VAIEIKELFCDVRIVVNLDKAPFWLMKLCKTLTVPDVTQNK